MTKPLAPEVVSPSSHRVYTGAIAIACGLTGAAIVAASVANDAMPTTLVIEPVVTCSAPLQLVPAPIEVAPAPVVAAAQPKAVDPRAGEVKLAFTAGGAAYVKLASIVAHGEHAEASDTTAEPMPKHGRAKLHGGKENEWTYSAIASVQELDMPAAYRAWKHREVTVDGTCRAKVVGFAVAARLDGDTGYAGVEGSWTAKTVMEQGARMLVAKLDGCQPRIEAEGIVRDASLPPVVEIEKSNTAGDAPLLAAARAKLIASELGDKAAEEWRVNEVKGAWTDAPTDDGGGGATFESYVLRHPTTQERFVAVHASVPWGCGGPNVNAFGLYRVAADGSLVKVVERELTVTKIDRFVDIDNDGTIELVGNPLFDQRAIEHATGDSIELLEKPFYGCAC